jgi:molybdenum cofactor synthesis domain-containing protein
MVMITSRRHDLGSLKPDEVSVADAQGLVLHGVATLPPVRVAISETPRLVLAQDVVAAESVPRFANSAMDGYALRAADTAAAPVMLRVIGDVAAGDTPRVSVSPGEAVRIMTGAPMPAGADAVCMVERTRSANSGLDVMIGQRLAPGTNVRYPGEDIAAGSTVFTAGTRLGPAHIGVLASLGIGTVLVYPRPTVGVLSTGDELVTDGSAPGPGQIRDANRPALLAQLACDGYQPVDLGAVSDDETTLAGVLQEAARRCDVIVASGGVSVGDHDVLKIVLSKLGGNSMRSLDVAVKPGRHVAFGRLGPRPTLAFGLPGNPVAALVAFQLFVEPALRAMSGHDPYRRLSLSAVADADLPRKPGPKLHLVRVKVRTDAAGHLYAQSSGGQDSHMLQATAQADALALLPDGHGVRAGDNVQILLLDTGLT